MRETIAGVALSLRQLPSVQVCLVRCAALLLVVASGRAAARDAGPADQPSSSAARSGAEPTTSTTPTTTHALRVGYVGSAPFVVAGDHPAGLSVQVWRTIADRAGFQYRMSSQPSVPAALAAVEHGQLDVAIGPISITSERARHVRFTQPYFHSHIGILARQGSAGVWSRIKPFVTRVFAGTSLALIVSLVAIGTLVWLIERKRNEPQFPPDAVRGIGNGVWFALVTMTTVGYGDRAPVTTAGRVLTGLWMLVALVTTSSLTAGLASAFTVLQLDTSSIRVAGDLQGKRVAVVRGTTGATFAAQHGAHLIVRKDLDTALAAVEHGDADAAVHDKPMLQYYLSLERAAGLQLAPVAYDPQGYGFATAGNVDLVRRLNVALLSSQEDGTLARITRAWLGSRE